VQGPIPKSDETAGSKTRLSLHLIGR